MESNLVERTIFIVLCILSTLTIRMGKSQKPENQNENNGHKRNDSMGDEMADLQIPFSFILRDTNLRDKFSLFLKIFRNLNLHFQIGLKIPSSCHLHL